MNLKSVLVLMIGLFAVPAVFAQVFTPPAEGFSRKKNAFITLEDGTQIVGKIKKIKRISKFAVFSNITVLDSLSGEKISLPAEKIKNMYLPPSELANFARASEFMSDVRNWDEEKREEYKELTEGYAYFEKTEFLSKRKDIEKNKEGKIVLVQLVNPTFCEKIKVYHNPSTQEQGGFQAGGLTVGGYSGDQSYFLKKGKDPAFVSSYIKYTNKEFNYLFGDCPEIVKKFEGKTKWADLADAIYSYETECE